MTIHTYDEIVPKDNEALFIGGQSGCGKTTLIERIVNILYRKMDELVIIIDSKPEWGDKDKPLKSWFNKLDKRDIPIKITTAMLPFLPKKGIFVYQTKYPDIADPGVDKIIRWALKRKKVTIVFDELGDFSKGSYTKPIIGKLLKQRRSKKVRVIIGSQRPSGIPVLAIDQSQKFCIFFLMNEDDRKRLAKWVHPAMMQQCDAYDFWFYEVTRNGGKRNATLMHQEVRKK